MTDISVNNLGLSVRASHALNRLEIHTVEQLLNASMDEIENARNIGKKTITEIQDCIEKCMNGEIDLESISDIRSSYKEQKRSFSEDEIQEMSQYPITDLNISGRPMNALLGLGCKTIADFALLSEDELRECKGVGKKSCDKALEELYSWIYQNISNFDENSADNATLEEEKCFYTKLSDLLFPIKQLTWRQWKKIFNDCLLNCDIELRTDDCNWNEIIIKVLSCDEFVPILVGFFKGFAPNGIIRVEDFFEKIHAINFQFNSDFIIERLLDGKICSQNGEVCYLNKPTVTQYMKENKGEIDLRIYEIMKMRLNGESLQIIADAHALTRERVRQILVKNAKKMPELLEDYYKTPYEHFKFTKDEFCSAFPECGPQGYEFLFLKYKKGSILVDEGSVSEYSGLFQDRIKNYWKEESLRRDKKHVTRTEMVYRILLSNSDRAMSMEEFENEYNSYLERRNYPKERLAINIRTVSNQFRSAQHIVFDKENRVRFCDADPKIIWDRIDFKRYKDLVISAELIYKDYADLMEELDIRDGYELFYVIKSSLEHWDCSDFEISCRRVPVMILGQGDEARQALQLLKEISPVDFNGYYEAYEERFGVRSANGNPVITGALVHYYLDGIYSVDVTAIESNDAERLREVLSIKNFWFNDEVEKLFRKICIHSSEDAFNRAAFKRIGYSLNVGYLYKDDYGSVVNYFDREIFSKEILDLSEYDRRLLVLSAFESALYKKRMDLDYIEVAPKVYMTVAELEKKYGLSLGDIQILQEWINRYDKKYFNAHSVWNELKDIGLTEKLQENEWLCTCIFRQQQTVFSQQVAGGIILCKTSSDLNLGAVCQWIVETNGKMSVQRLTSIFNETFATRVSVNKIAEKLKSYGLWDVLVTDSFDDYIDNLVVENDTDMDVDDLLQEEFY